MNQRTDYDDVIQKFNIDDKVITNTSGRHKTLGERFFYRTICKVISVHSPIDGYENFYKCQCIRSGECKWYLESELEPVKD